MIHTIARNGAGRRAAAFMLLVLAPYTIPAAAAETRAAQAEAFLDNLAGRGLAILKAEHGTVAERDRAFRELVHEGFALDLIGQFVAGRHWRTMRDDQRAEFQALFAEWLLTTYSRRLGGYDDGSMEIVDSLELHNNARDVLVRTRVTVADGGPPTAADWRVREIEGELKIIDVVVEHVSMALAQRAEIDAVIRRVGVEGLLEDLRSRVTVLVAGKE